MCLQHRTGVVWVGDTTHPDTIKENKVRKLNLGKCLTKYRKIKAKEFKRLPNKDKGAISKEHDKHLDTKELKMPSKTLINSYKRILMKTNDEIIMNDMLEAVYNKSNRSRVDLKNNDYIVVYDEELRAMYIYIANTEVDIERLEDDIRLLTSFEEVATLHINVLGLNIISGIISKFEHISYTKVNIICMSLDSVEQLGNEYVVRTATIKDKDAILFNIVNESGIKEDSNLYEYAVKDVMLKIRNNEFYVLTDNNVVLSQLYVFTYDNDIFIHGVLTNKCARNKGMATSMISQLASEFIKDGKSVHLSVLENNIAAKRAYAKIGFNQIGVSHLLYLHNDYH